MRMIECNKGYVGLFEFDGDLGKFRAFVVNT